MFVFLGPRLDWDPDVVAALDSDDVQVNPEDLLEDDFVAKVRQETQQNAGHPFAVCCN